jgi:hypothetical protein
MGKHQNTWSQRTKIIFREINIIFHSLGSLAGFPARVIVLWQEHVRGTRNASLASDCYNVAVDVVFKCLRQRSNGLNICLPAVFYMYVFSWFHSDNKTFIACWFRKYENLFTQEYHILLGRCPQGIWNSWVNKFSYFPHQHAINV